MRMSVHKEPGYLCSMVSVTVLSVDLEPDRSIRPLLTFAAQVSEVFLQVLFHFSHGRISLQVQILLHEYVWPVRLLLHRAMPCNILVDLLSCSFGRIERFLTLEKAKISRGAWIFYIQLFLYQECVQSKSYRLDV